MRIRSNLTSRARTPQHSSTGRHLFRLALMLVLVLLLMQRAADPEVYRRIFGALGAPLEGPAAVVQRAVAPVSERAAADSSADAEPLTATVAALDDDQQDELSALLATRRRMAPAEPGRASPALLQTLADAAEASGEVAPDRLRATLTSSAAADPEGLLERLQGALDAQYWSTVSDATVWQSGDANAFYRLLEKEPRFAEPPIRVGYSALTVQPQVYRGRPVSLEGHAVRVEPERAAENPFGIERYWLVWVRPTDGSERPMMVYTAQLPAALGGLSDDETLVDGPRIVAEGTFLKRHLYRSQRGSELAPVIVGTIGGIEQGWESRASAGPLDALGGEHARPAEPPRWWLAGVIAAVALPVLFTLWVGWQSSRNGRKQRELRARGMPAAAPLPDALGDPSPQREAP